jgi:hypothetical protein
MYMSEVLLNLVPRKKNNTRTSAVYEIGVAKLFIDLVN